MANDADEITAEDREDIEMYENAFCFVSRGRQGSAVDDAKKKTARVCGCSEDYYGISEWNKGKRQ